MRCVRPATSEALPPPRGSDPGEPLPRASASLSREVARRPCAAAPRRLTAALLASLAALGLGCEAVRPSAFERACPDYAQVVQPVLTQRCGQCHSPGDAAASGYAIGPYLDTVSRSDDGAPRVEAGDVRAKLLAAARGELPGHAALGAEETALLTAWVVDCRAAPHAITLHPKGFSTPTDREQFHGAALRDSGYAFAECRVCHGNDLRGGKSGADCNACHTQAEGPLACNTCHGSAESAAPPRALDGSRWTRALGVGAHRKHALATDSHPAFPCTTCHLEVLRVGDEGHYRSDGGFTLGRAQVRFSPALADAGARWEPLAATCEVACHHPDPLDTAARAPRPVWNVVSAGATACDSCHGQPPSNHFDARCATCHGRGYGDGGVAAGLHFNGTVDVVGADGRCDGCHGSAEGLPFYDLSQRTKDAGVPSAGAHDAHLRANLFRGPLGCGECHQVPATLGAPGHLDSAAPAEVFPASIAGSSLAFNNGAAPRYEPATGTCASYCHGGGTSMPADAGLQSPRWLGGPLVCGTSCHTLPPNDGNFGHTAAAAPRICADCHGATIAVDGGLLFVYLPDGGLFSNHLDGRVTGGER